MTNFNQLYNYKANWNNSYSTTKEISSYWNAGGAGPSSVFDYLSSNNVVLNAATITNSLSVLGNATIFGNLTALGTIVFVNTQVSVVSAVSGTFNNLFVESLTANEFFNPKFDDLYNYINAASASWEESAVIAPLQSASASWNSNYTTTNLNSSYWTEAYTNLVANSASYLSGTAGNLGDIPTLSANWNNTYNNVSTSSANWNNTYNNVSTNSANWNNTYTEFSTNSATYAYPAMTMLEVTNSGSIAYLFNNQYGGNNPTIYVISGTTIGFKLNIIGNHPFLIRYSGANYDTGLIHVTTGGVVTTGASAQGKISGTLYWQVPANIGGNYGYLCSNHGGMVGTIVVKSISAIP